MTPIAQLVAELREASDMRNHMPDAARSALTRAAEALARQEELLAEAGKVVEPFRDAHDAGMKAADGEPFDFGAFSEAVGKMNMGHFRAAARLSDKLKGE